MSDKQQIAQQVAATGGDVSAVWSWLHGILGGAVVWLGNQFIQTAIKDKLVENAEATKLLAKTLDALREELSEIKSESRERKAIAEAQQRQIDRIQIQMDRILNLIER